ncbi:MAG: hypothetical protein JXR88_17310 [Clostridia bacterium]|nr:hypothetical protein [Clostridia bacterium]
MPYFNNDDVYRQFAKEINTKADAEIDKLTNEIAETKEKNINRIKNELHTSIFRGLDLELNELNADFSANLNRVKNEYTRVLMKRRHELLDSVGKEAREKCLKFVESKDYKDFCNKRIKNISLNFCKKEIEFKIKKGDKVMKEAIDNHFEGKYNVKEVMEIEIGGFSATCYQMGIMVDETIDNKLKERQQWFYEHSDLAAK